MRKSLLTPRTGRGLEWVGSKRRIETFSPTKRKLPLFNGLQGGGRAAVRVMRRDAAYALCHQTTWDEEKKRSDERQTQA